MKHMNLQSLSAASVEELSIGYEAPESHPLPLQLLETADACVFAVDRHWRFVYANPSATMQISRGAPLIGVNLWEAFPEAKGTRFEDAYRTARETGQQQSFEAWFEPLDAWFEVCASPLPCGGLSVWFRNINVHKEKEQTLALAEEKFRLAASVAADLVSEWDIKSGRVTCSKGSEPRLGFDQEFVTDTQWCADRVHPQDRDRVQSHLQACLDDGDSFVCESRFLKPDGEYAQIEQRSILQRDQDGRPVRLISAMRDLTQQKWALGELEKREEQLRRIFSQALVGMMEAGPNGQPCMVNKRFCEILGRTEDELRSCKIEDYTHPDDIQANRATLDRSLQSGESFEIEKRYVRPDGSIVWCRVNVAFVLNPEGAVESSIVVAEDITERRELELARQKSELLHRSILEASQDCIKILNVDGMIEYINPAGVEIMELEHADKVIGMSWKELWPAATAKLIDEAIETTAEGETYRFTAHCPTAGGTPKWWDVLASPMKGENGELNRILAISRDITAQRESAEKIRWASEHDALTELPNRRAFEARLQAAILRSMERGTKVALLLIDLDHFKHVNDTLGHYAGDHLLGILSHRLRRTMRGGDFVARLGGDEFAVILEWAGGEVDLLEVGANLLSSIQLPVRFDHMTISANASIGGAVFPQDASSANELFKNADIALYALKDNGRGGTRLFEQHMREAAQLVAAQLSLARSVLANNSMVACYQPKVLLDSGRIVGFEALMRWDHGPRGLQLPETIGEAFKHYDLASSLGATMHSRVFSDMRKWRDDGVCTGVIAINAAPAEFLRDDYAERLLEKIHRYRIQPELVEVEVTEQVFFEQQGLFVARALQLLKSEGVRIALDDFGTGYSSLSHLRDFPVDVVKIDRSFIDKMPKDPEVSAIVSAVVKLAKSLGIDVVAEGVETVEQRAILSREGCLMGQGYLFGRAARADEIPHLLRRSPQILQLDTYSAPITSASP